METFTFKRHGLRLLFVLEGVRETSNMGLGLFPTMMKGDFHSVRKTVEAASSKGKIEQPEAGDHVGVYLLRRTRTKAIRE